MCLGVNSCDDSYIREVTCEGECKACVDRRPTVRQSDQSSLGRKAINNNIERINVDVKVATEQLEEKKDEMKPVYLVVRILTSVQ